MAPSDCCCSYHSTSGLCGTASSRSATRRTGSHQFYQIACIAGLSGVALQNFFSPNNRWAVAGMMYWTMFGLSMGIARLDMPDVQPLASLG